MIGFCTLSVVRVPRLDWSDAIRPHHLVVLMLNDVAVPDELTGCIKLSSYACDLARVRDNGVLEPGFPGLAWAHIAGELHWLHRLF